MNPPDRQPSAPRQGAEGEVEQNAGDASQTPAEDTDSHERRAVLVVENDEQSRRLIEQILSFSEYASLSASNGLEALAMLDRAHVDLVLMDISMPGLDGYQTVERMRKRAEFATTPIVAVSGLTASDERAQALRAGFTEYLGKPFRPKELLQLIDRLLSSAAQREGGPEERWA
jgi:CheY-like chemotaxis protein